MISLVTAIVARIRQVWPVGQESERQQWRREMESERHKAHITKEVNEAHLRRLSIQGRIAGDYRRELGESS